MKSIGAARGRKHAIVVRRKRRGRSWRGPAATPRPRFSATATFPTLKKALGEYTQHGRDACPVVLAEVRGQADHARCRRTCDLDKSLKHVGGASELTARPSICPLSTQRERADPSSATAVLQLCTASAIPRPPSSDAPQNEAQLALLQGRDAFPGLCAEARCCRRLAGRWRRNP
jgi:hypothetical protein